MAGLMLGGDKAPSAQGSLLPATITSINPTLALIDGATTPMPVLSGHPYYPLPGDRVALTRFGQQYLAMPVDMGANANTADDLWHAIGDPGEPAFGALFVSRVANPSGTVYGDSVRFFRDRAGVVWIEGLIDTVNNAGGYNGQVIFVLPPGYRPAYQLCFPAQTGIGTVQIGVDPNGSVYVQYGAGSVAMGFLSLDQVSFMAEDGPNPPTWFDLSANIPSTMQANTGGWLSTLPNASGTAYAGLRMCIDSVGDVHLSGIASAITPSSTANQNALVNLQSIGPLIGQMDTDFTNMGMFTVCASGTPGFARCDVFSSGTIALTNFGNATTTSAWFSLDGLSWPGGNYGLRYKAPTLLSSYANFGSGWAPAGLRVNKIGTVYMRGLLKGAAATVVASDPAYGSGHIMAPNINKIFSMLCASTNQVGTNRTDIIATGLECGLSLNTGQAPGAATTTYTSVTLRWTTKPYHS